MPRQSSMVDFQIQLKIVGKPVRFQETDDRRRVPSSAPMIPRVTAPATVRVTGDFMICSNVVGGGLAPLR